MLLLVSGYVLRSTSPCLLTCMLSIHTSWTLIDLWCVVSISLPLRDVHMIQEMQLDSVTVLQNFSVDSAAWWFLLIARSCVWLLYGRFCVNIQSIFFKVKIRLKMRTLEVLDYGPIWTVYLKDGRWLVEWQQVFTVNIPLREGFAAILNCLTSEYSNSQSSKISWSATSQNFQLFCFSSTFWRSQRTTHSQAIWFLE